MAPGAAELGDIEAIVSGPNHASTSTVTVTKKRRREEPVDDVVSSWRDQLGPPPTMGNTEVQQARHHVSSVRLLISELINVVLGGNQGLASLPEEEMGYPKGNEAADDEETTHGKYGWGWSGYHP